MANTQTVTIEARWLSACMSARSPSGSGDAQSCQTVSAAAANTLLAEADPCDQQDQADTMIDLAKVLNNNATMIYLAQIFRQQPRYTFAGMSVPYCQKASRNKELHGLFQCQYEGANPDVFSTSATMPFEYSRPVIPAGSCASHHSGPIPNQSQLFDFRDDSATTTTARSTSLPPTVIRAGSTATIMIVTGTATTSSLSHTSSFSASSSPTISNLSSHSDGRITVSKAVIGIIVVVILLLIAVVLFCIWYVRRKRASASTEDGESATIITPFDSDDKDLTLSLSSRALLHRDVDAGPATEDLQSEPYGLLPPNYDHVFNRPEDTFPLVASRRAPTYP